jgi:hypothetical protein
LRIAGLKGIFAYFMVQGSPWDIKRIYVLERETQQQQHKENVLVLKFMIEVKYRKIFGVCQGGNCLNLQNSSKFLPNLQ